MPRPMTDMIEVTQINDDDGHLPEKQAMQAQAMEHRKVTLPGGFSSRSSVPAHRILLYVSYVIQASTAVVRTPARHGEWRAAI